MALISVKLAKAGYFNGDPEKVLQAPADIVQNILDYEDFASEYEEEYLALNEES